MLCENLISKIIDENRADAFKQYGITPESFATPLEQSVTKFVIDYASDNEGKAPSYATVVGRFPDFLYTPEVTDSFEYLSREIKENEGKRRIRDLINKELPSLFTSSDTETVISTLSSKLELIKLGTSVRKNVGTDVKNETDLFLQEYLKRREGKSFKVWKSKFPTINKAIGGYYSGNVYTWYARSGRGKSVITMEEAIESACEGATVLIWAMEMARYEWMARAYTSLSSRQGLLSAHIDGIEYEAGFDNRALLSGTLPEEYEEHLQTFAKTLTEKLPGRIILRGVDDPDFRERNLRQLEADILTTKADVVVIDPIYYMDFENNTSRVAGGDVAQTSKGLRRLAGATGAVIHVITQADENAAEKDDDGVRELKTPKRAEIKKTKAVLEDAANVFGIDTLAHEGRGIIEIGKGRNGGEDTRVEILYLPNYGIVRELPTGQAAANQFMP